MDQQPLPLPGDPNDPEGLFNHVRRFLEWLATHNYSPRTVENRKVCLRYFLAWCEERDLKRPQAITKPILERYQRHLYYYRKANGEPLSFRSQAMRLIPVRAFFKWLARENYILYNPASELALPRAEKRLPKAVLSAEEAETVLAQPEVTKPLGLRDRAILELFYATGIRRLELVELNVWDIDYGRHTVMIRQGKGRKDRVVPLGERAQAWLEKYRDEVRPELALGRDEGVLFLTRHGSALEPRRLSQKVCEYVKQADIGKGGSCHLFRHSMATLMLENGADTRFIQAILGHESLETTQQYTQVGIAKLQAIHAATHPGVKLARAPHPHAGNDPEETAAPEDKLFAALAAEAEEEAQDMQE